MSNWSVASRRPLCEVPPATCFSWSGNNYMVVDDELHLISENFVGHQHIPVVCIKTGRLGYFSNTELVDPPII